MFKIEKNVPTPSSMAMKYPWNEMNIGDSFLVELGGRRLETVRANLFSSANINSVKHHGGKRKYKTRTVNDGSAIRVWRIE